MLATAPAPAPAVAGMPAPGKAPPAYSTALLPVVRVPIVLGAQTAPNTVLGMERGAVKLVTLSPTAEAKVIEVRLVPLVENKPAANPATQMDLPKLAADKAPLMVFFPGSKLYLGSAAGKKLMFSMRAVPLQAWAVVARSEQPGTYMLVSHSKPEFALGLEGEKVSTVPSDSPQNILLLTVDAIQPPAPPADAGAAAAPAAAGAPKPAGAAPAARPAGPAARKAPPQVMDTKAAASAVADSKLDASILDSIKNKGNHGLEIAVPVALQYKDRMQYLTAASLADPNNSTELMFAKLDPVRDGGQIAYFELLTLVAEADDPSKISLKHFDGKAKRDQAAVIFDSRTQRFLAARHDGSFYTRDDVASEDVLWQVVKDPSAQLAVSIVHFRNQKRLVAEHQKPGSGVMAKRSPIVLRCKGDVRAPVSEEDCVFTLCPEKTAQTDLGFQAKGHETRMERIRTIATIVSPFAMAASATVGVVTASMSILKSSGGSGNGNASNAAAQQGSAEGAAPVVAGASTAGAASQAQQPAPPAPAPIHAGENGAQQGAGDRNGPEIRDINGDGRIDARDLTEDQFKEFQEQANASRDDGRGDRDDDRLDNGRDRDDDRRDNNRDRDDDDDRRGNNNNRDRDDDDDDRRGSGRNNDRDDDNDDDRRGSGRNNDRDDDNDDSRVGHGRDDEDLDALDVDGLDLDADTQDQFPGGSPAPTVPSPFTREPQQQSSSQNNGRDADREDDDGGRAGSGSRLDALEAGREQPAGGRDADREDGRDGDRDDGQRQDADADADGLDEIDVENELAAEGFGADQDIEAEGE